jgi:alkyldihydroxyacetonephosphate synthase
MRTGVTDSLRGEAKRIVGDAWYRDSTPDRIAYGRDCWPLGILWTRGGKIFLHNPDFIVIPGTVEEVAQLVKLARESGTPVIPYGAGSGVCGGTVAFEGGFTLDVKRLSGITRFDTEALMVRAGAGTIGMHLETDLLRRGYTMGHYPSSLICSSLGGYLAGRSAGQNSSRFGKIEDMCFSMQVVAGTGEIIETHRYQPDLTQLFLGSEGTLGVITQGTMRIEPAPQERIYRGVQFHSIDAALGALREMVQAGYRPAVVRVYDELDSLLARRKDSTRKREGHGETTPTLVKRLTTFARSKALQPIQPTIKRAADGLLKRALGAPMMLNRLTGMVPGGCLMVVGFEGLEGITKAEANSALELLYQSGTDMGSGPGEHWYENRFAVSYKQSGMLDRGAFVDTMEVCTTWDNLQNLYRAVRQAVSPHAFIMAHFSHAYPEGCSIYFTFAGFAADGDAIEALYKRTWSAGLNAVRRVNAGISHHHGIGFAKAQYLAADHAGGEQLNRILKSRFDPDGVMNPGKLWDVQQVEAA